ncbi:BTAD domain-containing putative transcriptional regulator [Streptomyces sp. NPDC090442]|uniref:AfsR/SARP family transcriptional regulator n=1 Tax=Streptomyces sp. NPDC090442 TaxID=3365962 RepID=UPI003821923B
MYISRPGALLPHEAVAAKGKAGVRISRAPVSFRLNPPSDARDLLRFRQLREQGHAAAGRGQDGAALELLAEALSRWQGSATAGVPVGTRQRPVIATADRERAETAGAALRCSAQGRILQALRIVAHQNPLDEALRAKHVLALGAHAQKAEALTVYQQVRRRLADDYDVDPTSQLRAAQRKVLRQTQDVRGRGASGSFDDSLPRQRPAPAGRSVRRVNSPLHQRPSSVADR